jgi:hypothetical protein
VKNDPPDAKVQDLRFKSLQRRLASSAEARIWGDVVESAFSCFVHRIDPNYLALFDRNENV